MGDAILSRNAEQSCPSCGTPIKHGVTTQYVDDIDAEICAVCEQVLAT